jgi:exodeoxyribonuclease VII large subunit
MSLPNFFDFQQQVKRRRGATAAVPPAATGGGGEDPLTVSQLTARITRVVRAGMPQAVLVKGEVSNYRPNASSGHVYFTLKDADSCIDCVIFKSDAARVKFTPDNGMELIAQGRVDVYGARGKYQLYVSNLHPVGQGALELAFQQLKSKLEAEGLFAADRKRPLPGYPARIAIVTSASTAALQDVLKVFSAFPFLRLGVYNVPVQGDGAGERIARGIEAVNAGAGSVGGFDVLLLIRGGGSLEDLWCFNEEVVARAVAASGLPVITGIGHEIDTSIADLVADYWAHTPTEAAQVLTQNWRGAGEYLDVAGERLRRNTRNLLRDARQRLQSVERHELFRRPTDRINQFRQLLDDRERTLTFEAARLVARLRARVGDAAQRLSTGKHARFARERDRIARLATRLAARHPQNAARLAAARLRADATRLHLALGRKLGRDGERLAALSRELDALSPEAVLRRGYGITRRKRDGVILHSASEVKTGDTIVTRLAKGEVTSVVEDGKQPKLFE